MTPIELIPLLDTGMVEELRMYYNGHHSVVDIRNIPEALPGYQITKMWNSENGKGISVLLADNMADDSDDNGKWIARKDMNYLDENKIIHEHFMCDRCGFIHDFIDGHTTQYKYCPNCGARMIKEENEE